jgi:hypothetical protein
MPQLVFLSLCLVLLLPLTARAQLPTARLLDASGQAELGARAIGIGADLGVSVRSDNFVSEWVASSAVGATYQLTPQIALGLDWGFLIAHESGGQTLVDVANPIASGSYAILAGPRDRLYGRAALTAPLAWLSHTTTRRGFLRGSYAYAAGMRGLWSAWLWGPEQAALSAGAQWSHVLTSRVRFGAEADLGGSVPFEGITQAFAIDTFAQLAPWIELRIAPVRVGLRAQAVWMFAASDMFASSLVHYLAVDWRNVSIEGRAVINLDEPIGITGAGQRIWGLLISGQGRL